MAIDSQALVQHTFSPVIQDYSKRDTMLYAAGIGFGMDPADERQLPFLFEDRLQTVPSMAAILASPGFWLKAPEIGADWKRILHGEQGVEIIKPLPPAARVIGQTRIVAVVDKGRDKGAFVHVTRDIRSADGNELYARALLITVLRGDGGCGSAGEAPEVKRFTPPECAPDVVCDLPTSPQSAVVYRLSGDNNPLHIDHAVARAAGFKLPILHGLCTYGVATHALLRGCCDYNPYRIKSVHARFSTPVYPGETIRTEMWRADDQVLFRSSSVERGVVVLGDGHALLAS
jgi:acyl dehydratase